MCVLHPYIVSRSTVPWTEQDEEAEVEVYKVGTCQGATGAETGAVKQSSASQCKEAEAIGADERAPEPDNLVLEGEEQEYFLELLMRRASPERPQKGQAAGNKGSSKDKAAVTEGKEKRRSKKKERKALKKGEAGRGARGQERKEIAEGPACNVKKQAALDLLNNPEAKGGGLGASQHGEKEQVTRSQVTSGGECSGQKMPDGS
jgi:hypothetical protein